jgi:hypothetical protein
VLCWGVFGWGRGYIVKRVIFLFYICVYVHILVFVCCRLKGKCVYKSIYIGGEVNVKGKSNEGYQIVL